MAQKYAFTRWDELNAAVMATTDEALLTRYLQAEAAGKARRVFLERIHSRLSRVRYDRERSELATLVGGG